MAQVIVVPTNQPTIQEAVDAANENDVILVQPGTYNETVKIETVMAQNKNGIKILANGCGAILDGNIGSLHRGFELKNVTGVEIRGFTIKNYFINGIILDKSNNNRIICNKIMDIPAGNGIGLSDSSGNLIWKNTVKRTSVFGVIMQAESKFNWIIENVVRDSQAGFYAVLAVDANNAFIGNCCFNSEVGIIANSTNTFIMGNKVFINIFGIVALDNCVLLDNEIRNSTNAGVILLGNNNLVADNEISESLIGIVIIDSNSNSIRNNEIKNNTFLGIGILGNDNLFINNDFEGNAMNVFNDGTGNVFLKNDCTPSDPPFCS